MKQDEIEVFKFSSPYLYAFMRELGRNNLLVIESISEPLSALNYERKQYFFGKISDCIVSNDGKQMNVTYPKDVLFQSLKAYSDSLQLFQGIRIYQL